MAIGCLFLASCTKTVVVEKERKGPPPHAKAWGHKKKHRTYYYYYPTSNVYFDITFGQYVYFSAGAWVRMNTLPSGVTIGSDRVRIDYQGDDVYVYNSNHKSKYKSKYKSVPPGQAKKMSYGNDDNGRGNGNGNGNGKGKGKGKKGH
ncbi:hypothetical protein D3C72_864430 [compost metagenome]